MKKKAFSIIAFILAMTTLLCACGGKQPNEEETKSTGGGKAMKLWITTLGEEAEVIKKVTTEQWNAAHPDTPVEVTVVPGNSDDFYQKLSTAFATETGPDMFCISNSEIQKYVEAGISYDVSQWLEPNRADYMEGALEALTYDGRLVAFPGNMDIMALYCNAEMFEDASLEYPRTWDELVSAVDALATDDNYGIILQTDLQSGYQLFEFYPFLWMCGGSILSDDGMQVTINSEATKQAFSFYKEIFAADGTCKKVENSNTDITPFGTGRTAMQICGSWAVSWLQENYPDLEYAVVPYPVPDAQSGGSSIIGGWQYMVSAKGANPQAAAEYLNWLWNDGIEIPQETATKGAKVSPRLSVMDASEEYYSQYPFNVFVDEILPTAQREPAYAPGIVKAVGDGLQEAIYTDNDIGTIVAEMESDCQKALK